MKAIFYDSDCISCFLIINHAELLKKLFNELIITEQVYEELIEIHTPKIVRIGLKKLIKEKYIKFKRIVSMIRPIQNINV